MATVNFYLRFDDENNGLSRAKGLSMKELSILLRALDELSNPGDNSFITVTGINEGSYSIEVLTTSEIREEKIKRAHQNISYKSFDELSEDEVKYAAILQKNLLKGLRFVEYYDHDNKLVSTIKAREIGREIESYSIIKSVSGVISEIGSKSLDNKKTHIEVDKLGYRIFTTQEQDFELRTYYRERRLTFRIKQKISISNGKVSSATLIDFTPSSKGTMIENLSKISIGNLDLLRGIQTHDDILKLIRE